MSLFGRGKIKGPERDELLEYFKEMDRVNEIYRNEVKKYRETLSDNTQCFADSASEQYEIEQHRLMAQTEEKLVWLTEEALKHIKGLENIPAQAKDLHASYIECYEAYSEWKKAAFVAAKAALQGLPSPVADDPSALYDKAAECAQRIDEMEYKLRQKLT